jgi:hypothetical protein
MSIRPSGTLRLCAALAAGALALTVAACGPNPAAAPPGPPTGTVIPGTPGAGATGESAHSGASAVTPEVRAAAVAAMEKYGIAIADPSKLGMSYSQDRQHMTVTGGGMTLKPPAVKQAGGSVASVQLENVNGTWRVTVVAGQQ